MVLYKIAVLAATIMDGDGKQMKTSPVVLKTVQQCTRAAAGCQAAILSSTVLPAATGG